MSELDLLKRQRAPHPITVGDWVWWAGVAVALVGWWLR